MAQLSAPIVLALALIGGGVAGGATVALVGSSSNTDSTRREPIVLSPAGDSGALEEQLAALDAENQDLRLRLAALELRSGSTPREPAVEGEAMVTRAEFDALREELEGFLARRGFATPESPVFQEQVAQALEAVRHGERVDKVQGYQSKKVERLEEDITVLEAKLDLTPNQTQSLRSVLLAQYDREAELIRQWEEGAEDEVLAQSKQELTDTFQTELAGVLSEDQVQTFWQVARSRGK